MASLAVVAVLLLISAIGSAVAALIHRNNQPTGFFLGLGGFVLAVAAMVVVVVMKRLA